MWAAKWLDEWEEMHSAFKSSCQPTILCRCKFLPSLLDWSWHSFLQLGSFQSWLSPSVVHGELKMVSSPSVAAPSLNLLLCQISENTAWVGVQNKLAIIWRAPYQPDLGNSHSMEKVFFPTCARKDGNIWFYFSFKPEETHLVCDKISSIENK